MNVELKQIREWLKVNTLLKTEVVAQSRSVKKVLLEISQNAQENACARVSQVCNFIKKETLAQVFSYKLCKFSKNIFSYRAPLVAASLIKVSIHL